MTRAEVVARATRTQIESVNRAADLIAALMLAPSGARLVDIERGDSLGRMADGSTVYPERVILTFELDEVAR